MRVDQKISFVHFTLPFLFEPSEFERRKDAFEKASMKTKGGQTCPVWEKTRFPSDDLLEHVSNYLNPPEGKPATAHLWKLNDELQDFFGLGNRADWFLTNTERRIQIPFQFGELGKGTFAVQLSLFRVGVGFVTVRLKVKSEKVDDWLNFLDDFRFAKGQRGAFVRAEKRTGFDQSTRQPIISPFFPEPALEQGETAGDKHEFFAILKALLRTGSFDGEEDWWREVFVRYQLIPYAALFINEADERDIPELLYRVRNFFAAYREINPSDDDLRLDHPALLPYAKNQWFICTLEGGAFVAFNAPQTEFFRTELPNRLKEQYFLLFLLAQHQRFALIRLSQEVSEHWLRGSEKERVKIFEQIRNDLLEFTARGYFSQVMQRERHHRCYRKWQEVLMVEQLYQEVSNEVREMHEILQSRRSQRLEERINLLTAFFAVPALVLSFLSINLYGVTAREEGLSLLTALGITVASFLFGGLVWLWLKSH